MVGTSHETRWPPAEGTDRTPTSSLRGQIYKKQSEEEENQKGRSHKSHDIKPLLPNATRQQRSIKLGNAGGLGNFDNYVFRSALVRIPLGPGKQRMD